MWLRTNLANALVVGRLDPKQETLFVRIVASHAFGGFYRSLLHGLGFECIESLLWGVPSEGFSGAIVEFVFDFEESFGAVNGEVGPFRKIAAKEPVSVLVTWPLPWRVGLTEEHGNTGFRGELVMKGHLNTLVPRQGQS
jgi:hypothetical protein